MNTVWISLIPFALFFVWLFTGGARRSCPSCARSLPRVQSPFTKTQRQWLEGGWVCSHCGCEVDRAGQEVVAGAVSNRRARMLHLSRLASGTLLAAILLALLLAYPHS